MSDNWAPDIDSDEKAVEDQVFIIHENSIFLSIVFVSNCALCI